MSKQLQEIKHALANAASIRNKQFFETMVPGKQKVYGVKTPALNEIAKNYKEYSFSLAEELWQSGALEEKIIAIKIVEKTGKTEPKKTLRLVKKFSKTIDNWAVCDGLGMQFIRGIVKTHRKEIFETAESLAHSKNMWQRRLALVMIEWYTRHNENHEDIRKIVSSLEKDKEYYVQKAIQWIKRNLDKNK